MAACSYEATRRYEKDEEPLLPFLFSGALVGIAFTGQILRRRQTPQIADAKTLCVIGIGAPLLVSHLPSKTVCEQNQKALEQAAMERDIFFRRSVACGEDLYAFRREFTKKERAVCVDSEFSTIFGAREMYQRRWVSDVNALICKPSIPYFQALWPHLTNLTLNETHGEWPCGAPKADENDATRQILQHYAKLHAPMSVTLLPVNDSCYRVLGQGTRSLHMTTLCIKPFLLDYLDSPVTDCVTDEFREYMIEYASEFSFPQAPDLEPCP